MFSKKILFQRSYIFQHGTYSLWNELCLIWSLVIALVHIKMYLGFYTNTLEIIQKHKGKISVVSNFRCIPEIYLIWWREKYFLRKCQLKWYSSKDFNNFKIILYKMKPGVSSLIVFCLFCLSDFKQIPHRVKNYVSIVGIVSSETVGLFLLSLPPSPHPTDLGISLLDNFPSLLLGHRSHNIN